MIVMYGNYYTGWYSDVPHLIATCASESGLIQTLQAMREVYEQCVVESELEEILDNLNISHGLS